MKILPLLFVFFAHPVLADSVFQMEEIFRISQDESQPYVFGIIEDLQFDQNGDIYILDTQIKNVKVFSRSGAFLRTIGREGSGPGELTAPGSMVLFGENGLGVVSKRFGRITKIDKITGDPLGRFRVEGREKMNTSLGRVKWSDPFFIAVISEAVGEEFLFWRRYLGVFPDSAEDLVFPETILQEVGWNTGKAREENEYYGIWDPWAVLPSGSVILVPFWTSYELDIFDLTGQQLTKIKQPFQSRLRGEQEKNRYLDLICGGISPEVIGVEMVLEDHEAVVRRVFPRGNGDIWVQTSAPAKEGVFLELDCFDSTGNPFGVVSVIGPGDSFRDQYYFGPDNVLFVIHGGEGFIHTHRGRDSGDTEYELDLVCYKMVLK